MSVFGSRISGFFSGASTGGGGTGTVTSVGLSMPSGFTVGGTNPVTSSGTISVTGAGTINQYIRGDGTLANFPNVGGGGGQVYYFNGNTSQGTIGGNTYYQLGLIAGSGAAANFTKGTTGVIARFITDVGVPNQINIPAGNWAISIYLSEAGGGSNHAEITATLFKYDGVTVTDLFTSVIEEITNGSVVDLYNFDISVSSTTLTATDRLGIYFSISNTNGKTVTLYTEDGRIGQVATTFSTGITSLNSLTAATQTFATGTTGTDFNISSVSPTHTFNLPTASGTNRGALSSADWTTFNDGIVLTAYGLLGSSYKSASLSVFNPAMISTSGALANGTIRFSAIYVPIAATITGVRWFHATQGNYTANNYNGVGLYSYSGGTLTLVASSTNDGNIWKPTTNTWSSKALSSTYAAAAGLYFIAAAYSASAETTPPTIGSAANMANAAITGQDFTNSAKLVSSVAGTSLPATQAMSGTTNVNINYGFWLY